VVTTRRASHERARWLLAVLIVVSIAAASAAIVRWPLPPPPAVPASVANAAEPVDSPRSPRVARAIVVSEPVRSTQAAKTTVELRPVVAAASDPIRPESTVVVVTPPVATNPAVSLLASRRLNVVPLVPMLAAHDMPGPEAAIASPHGLVEIPAVAVTRVVTIAGRGLWTGVRASAAVFRAAF
jgi:hypothetical protein